MAAEARLQQIESLGDVRWAVLETNGRISFIPREGSGGGSDPRAEDVAPT